MSKIKHLASSLPSAWSFTRFGLCMALLLPIALSALSNDICARTVPEFEVNSTLEFCKEFVPRPDNTSSGQSVEVAQLCGSAVIMDPQPGKMNDKYLRVVYKVLRPYEIERAYGASTSSVFYENMACQLDPGRGRFGHWVNEDESDPYYYFELDIPLQSLGRTLGCVVNNATDNQLDCQIHITARKWIKLWGNIEKQTINWGWQFKLEFTNTKIVEVPLDIYYNPHMESAITFVQRAALPALAVDVTVATVVRYPYFLQSQSVDSPEWIGVVLPNQTTSKCTQYPDSLDCRQQTRFTIYQRDEDACAQPGVVIAFDYVYKLIGQVMCWYSMYPWCVLPEPKDRTWTGLLNITTGDNCPIYVKGIEAAKDFSTTIRVFQDSARIKPPLAFVLGATAYGSTNTTPMTGAYLSLKGTEIDSMELGVSKSTQEWSWFALIAHGRAVGPAGAEISLPPPSSSSPNRNMFSFRFSLDTVKWLGLTSPTSAVATLRLKATVNYTYGTLARGTDLQAARLAETTDASTTEATLLFEMTGTEPTDCMSCPPTEEETPIWPVVVGCTVAAAAVVAVVVVSAIFFLRRRRTQYNTQTDTKEER